MTEFRLTGQIGSGGMATVYAGEWLFPGDEAIPVACKILHPDRVDPRRTGLFWREAVINLRISHNHPRLVSVHECFSLQGGELCMVMELVEGCSVADLVDAIGPLPVEVVRRIAVDVLDGLRYMHGRDVLHRDISPNNLLVSRHGELKIADLGLAKPIPEGRGQASNSFCTFAYASPEVLRRGTVDPRSDLYSLGAVLYELVTGCRVHGEGDTDQTMDRALAGEFEPLPEWVPEDLRALITGVLAVDPARRHPSSAQGALDLLDQCDGAVATPDALARMVAPIHEARPPYAAVRGDDRIEAPIVFFGKPTAGWEKRATDDIHFQIQRFVDEEPPRRAGRLALWWIVAVLILAPWGYLGWRALAPDARVTPVAGPVETTTERTAPTEQAAPDDRTRPESTSTDQERSTARNGEENNRVFNEENNTPRARRQNARSRRMIKPGAVTPAMDPHYTPVPEGDEIHIFAD